MAAVVAVPSRLRSISLKKAVSHLDMYEQFLESLPSEVKDSFLQLMSKRGLLTDRNIGSLLHPGVTEIELSECDISDEGLKAICQCPRLQKLDLNSTKDVRTSITASGIKQATQHCKYLRILFLRRCTLVDDSVVKWMGQYCPYITQLNLGGCKLVTDLGVQSLADSCSHLQSLNLSKTKVTDKGLCCLARGACAKALQELHLSHCIDITDTGVEALVEGCPNLQILIFHGCPLTTDRSRIAMEQLGQMRMRQLTWTVY